MDPCSATVVYLYLRPSRVRVDRTEQVLFVEGGREEDKYAKVAEQQEDWTRLDPGTLGSVSMTSDARITCGSCCLAPRRPLSSTLIESPASR